mmetsp:Transcript_28195/g.75240  ORF Transcript_28195/g.75240 Transcript_28195/m.75240 type:complete len:232 (-) Transcript_28195:86-781(-)
MLLTISQIAVSSLPKSSPSPPSATRPRGRSASRRAIGQPRTTVATVQNGMAASVQLLQNRPPGITITRAIKLARSRYAKCLCTPWQPTRWQRIAPQDTRAYLLRQSATRLEPRSDFSSVSGETGTMADPAHSGGVVGADTIGITITRATKVAPQQYAALTRTQWLSGRAPSDSRPSLPRQSATQPQACSASRRGPGRRLPTVAPVQHGMVVRAHSAAPGTGTPRAIRTAPH